MSFVSTQPEVTTCDDYSGTRWESKYEGRTFVVRYEIVAPRRSERMFVVETVPDGGRVRMLSLHGLLRNYRRAR